MRKWGGWPKELGIYGGGEHFMNYTLSVLGHRKMIYPHGVLCHHGEKRAYYWNYDDHIRNRILATYLFGGKAVGQRFISMAKGRPQVLQKMLDEVSQLCIKQREQIKKQPKNNNRRVDKSLGRIVYVNGVGISKNIAREIFAEKVETKCAGCISNDYR